METINLLRLLNAHNIKKTLIALKEFGYDIPDVSLEDMITKEIWKIYRF